MSKRIDVSAAIVIQNEDILCVQRGISKFSYISKKYEFPGGKIEKKESAQSAIKREIMEELSLSISVIRKFLAIDHQYPDFRIRLHSFICKCDSRDIILHEHLGAVWLPVMELDSLDWAEADMPIVKKLMKENNE